MTVETKIYLVRLMFWLLAIVVVAWPLHLARPEIGDVAYVVGAALVLGACYGLGQQVSKHIVKAQQQGQS